MAFGNKRIEHQKWNMGLRTLVKCSPPFLIQLWIAIIWRIIHFLLWITPRLNVKLVTGLEAFVPVGFDEALMYARNSVWGRYFLSLCESLDSCCALSPGFCDFKWTSPCLIFFAAWAPHCLPNVLSKQPLSLNQGCRLFVSHRANSKLRCVKNPSPKVG